ncbi:MAG: hypothetical protein ACPL1K_08210 [Candidatus Kryptoniota bacterium]
MNRAIDRTNIGILFTARKAPEREVISSDETLYIIIAGRPR